jgi:hypothetical protein
VCFKTFDALTVSKYFTVQRFPDFQMERCFMKVPRLGPFVLPVRVTVDEIELWYNDTDKGKRKYADEDLSQCQFHRHKSHIDWPEIEPGTPQ